jgi:adenosine kinase
MKYSSIIVTGSIAYDEIMDFPSEFQSYFHPEKLHQINVSFVVDKLEKQLGGTGTNIAYNVSLMTGQSVHLLAGVGKDGRDFMEFFARNHIDTKGIIIDNTLFTATGKVITDIKDNQIWGFYYGACEKGKDVVFTPFTKESPLMIISANHPKAFLHAQKEAIRLQIDYMYDPGMAMTWITDEDLKEGIDHATYVVGNDYEIAMISKRLSTTVEQWVADGKKVITTLGEKGVLYEDTNQKLHVSGCGVEAVDPTGAGDAWRGGFMAGLVEGKTIEESLKQANAIASFAVEKYGTVNHGPTHDEIKKRAESLKVNNSVQFV